MPTWQRPQDVGKALLRVNLSGAWGAGGPRTGTMGLGDPQHTYTFGFSEEQVQFLLCSHT